MDNAVTRRRNGSVRMMASDVPLVRVEDYLASVREEEGLLPTVIFASARKCRTGNSGRTAAQFERLRKISVEAMESDTRFLLKNNELDFFKHMKARVGSSMRQAKSHHHCALLNYCYNLLPVEISRRLTGNFLPSLGDEQWVRIFSSEAPDVMSMARAGISFSTVQQILHYLANYICEDRGRNIHEQSSMWLFVILVLLDDLHAMQESVAYELQRLKRAFARHVPSMIDSLAIYDTDSEDDQVERERAEMAISGYVLNICIIRQHFKQW
ncbi:survival of motor neuron interacting protein, putative [Babesia ovis]|uniref:Survival of motor neuron interacting protein, putative n=1 Tax=Babesia ovis TaxID=5869 RepID=A0A9W5TBQ6_BABOV|nr:survival of motor neuron interacting protein, putative [Babesia ovis]